MVQPADIRRVLARILDPEMPINLIDLGIIQDVRVVGVTDEAIAAEVDVTPTFVGCPALHVIEQEIKQRVGDLPGIESVAVNFVHNPPWSVDRISPAGRAALKDFGVTVPEHGSTCCSSQESREQTSASHATLVPLTIAAPGPRSCPFCGSAQVHLESAFGPTRCKMIYYCDACLNTFEHLKRV